MSFRIQTNLPEDGSHVYSGADSYSVNTGGALVVNSGGQRITYAAGVWRQVIDANPT